ncbi:MAG: dihydrolipoamide acetyltransferase family protein [Gemmatimonadota bacterium]
MARIEVPMPQMGESIAEGTVSKWLKQVGDSVERDEPTLEISTDKVDAEIPSPQAGILEEVMVGEGETVEVGTIIAYIETEGGGSAAASSTGSEPETDAAEAEPEAEAASDGADEVEPEESEPAETQAPPVADEETGSEQTAEERLRQRSTPLVRRMAEEHGVDLSELEGKGSGHGGRVTKQDLLQHLGKSDEDVPEPTEKEPTEKEPTEKEPTEKEPTEKEPAEKERGGAEEGRARVERRTDPDRERPAATAARRDVTTPSEFWNVFNTQVQHPEFPVREGDDVETMDRIRRLTAEHMVLAKRIAPHVHSFIEVDFTRVDQLRRANKNRWEEQGARVSFTAFVAWALSRVLREFPMINATASGNNIIYRGSVNLGIAVDLDPGLIVPVIRDADDLSLVGIGKKVVDLAERARSRKLSPDEIQGATFAITNPGVLGTLVGMPIIPKGTAGILGTGAIEKRVVVVEDAETGVDSIAIRKRAVFSLGYDHRIVDGADAARFLSRLKEMLEDFPEDA